MPSHCVIVVVAITFFSTYNAALVYLLQVESAAVPGDVQGLFTRQAKVESWQVLVRRANK
jgi:hypothetical protein